jgi:GH15 family glucan-1,4-alpha-glucosidase
MEYSGRTIIHRSVLQSCEPTNRRVHPGPFIASLALPWGFSKGDKDQGGYHLVWTRDMVETAGGLLAAHAHGDTRRVLDYLRSTQQPDGHWAQNMWIDGNALLEWPSNGRNRVAHSTVEPGLS